MISIIVPVYKVERYLHQCINSLLNQTYKDIEILLIDDGSPDECGDICDYYSRNDSRIKVFHTENKGLSSARNLGIQEAKGEYIGFVDSDDWVEPDMYRILLKELKENNAEISACAIRREYVNDKEDYNVHKGHYVNTEAIRILICACSDGAWNKLYKKKYWDNVRFPNYRDYEDIATIYKVVLNAHSIVYTPEPLYHYRMRSESIVHTPSMRRLIDYWNAHCDRYLFLDGHPEIKKDQEIISTLRMYVAQATAKIWRHIYYIPPKQRDYAYLQMISCFVRDNYPLFGEKDWKLRLRINFFLSRYANKISFLVLFFLAGIYRILVFRKRKMYPST